MNSILDSEKNDGGPANSLVPAADEMENTVTDSESGREEPYILSTAAPESTADTIRKSGMAYSAGIAFFASVVFMLVIGWGADLLFGSSPWGIVGGIVLGSIIGFIQFFRITSQIFRS
jgi:F0F1-type ATP synthase assembly protein I